MKVVNVANQARPVRMAIQLLPTTKVNPVRMVTQLLPTTQISLVHMAIQYLLITQVNPVRMVTQLLPTTLDNPALVLITKVKKMETLLLERSSELIKKTI